MIAPCCKEPTSKRKRKQTPNAVEGLLTAADKISEGLPSGMRHSAFKGSLGTLPEGEQKAFGQYQGRVVLMALALELALKFAYEQDHLGESAPPTHDLYKLFQKLKDHRKQAIKENYEHLFDEYDDKLKKRGDIPPEEWWRNLLEALKKCRNTSVNWRFIEERGRIPTEFEMRATCLGLAAESTVEEIRAFQQQLGKTTPTKTNS